MGTQHFFHTLCCLTVISFACSEQCISNEKTFRNYQIITPEDLDLCEHIQLSVEDLTAHLLDYSTGCSGVDMRHIEPNNCERACSAHYSCMAYAIINMACHLCVSENRTNDEPNETVILDDVFIAKEILEDYINDRNNLCLDLPCENNGSCIRAEDQCGFWCSCPPGYQGHFCQYEIDECGSNPCQNQAPCTDMVNAYWCSCINGYEGINCEVEINECESSPCLNGGTCSDTLNAYTCQCPSGFYGSNCENEINECDSDPCRNGAQCQDLPNEYHCACADGYQGTQCQDEIDECSSSPCQNGGACQDMVNAFTCTCPCGYSGAQCQVQQLSDAPCEFALIFGSEYGIAASALTATSQYASDYTAVDSALCGEGAWSMLDNDYDGEEEWIQADFGTVQNIVAVLTQGSANLDEYVTKYKLELSDNGSWFTFVSNPLTGDDLFEGNSDPNTVHRNDLPSGWIAKKVRLYPMDHYGWPSLRWEILGCPYA